MDDISLILLHKELCAKLTTLKDKARRSRQQRRRKRLRNKNLRFRKHRCRQAIFYVTFPSIFLGQIVSYRRRCWSFPRTESVWRDAFGWWDDGHWLSHFRMRKCTFTTLCEKLRPHMKKKETKMRKPTCYRKLVGATIWKLATNVDFRTISLVFGVSKSLLVKSFHTVCKIIVNALLPQYIALPDPARLRAIIAGFCRVSGLPQVGGAIDGTLIEILAPVENACDYYCRKSCYAINMQAVVDHEGLFVNCYVGWAGKVHDARVFSQSQIFSKGCSGSLFPRWYKNIEGVKVPVYLLGDPAYPLLPWLMKPYPDTNLNEEQVNFNFKHSSARMTVERAFGRLKGRWRCLLKRLDHAVHSIPTVVLACCVLHNICELNNESFDENLYVYPNCDIVCLGTRTNNYDNTEANTVRNALARHLYNMNI